MPTLDGLADDLCAMQAALLEVLVERSTADWDRRTPSPNWSVRHQVRHLAHGEELGRLAATDPTAFEAELARLVDDLDAVEAVVTAPGEEADTELLRRWWSAAEGLRAAVLAGPPGERIPWVTGPMSRTSFLTARVMETFAHGHDIGVALGVDLADDRALPHVAHLGRATRDFAYLNRGLPAPSTDVRLELLGPSGDLWTFGPVGAADLVRGPARDLCLVVTRRVHPHDTALVASGPHAATWLSIAQCFAGPPSDGPEPGKG